MTLFSSLCYMPFCNWKMKMMIFCGQKESYKSGCREMLLCFPPPWKNRVRTGRLPYAIYSHEAFVPVTEMTLCGDLAPCLVEIKAGLPLKGEL